MPHIPQQRGKLFILSNKERNGFYFFQKRKICETYIHHLTVLSNNFLIKRKIQGRIQENLQRKRGGQDTALCKIIHQVLPQCRSPVSEPATTLRQIRLLQENMANKPMCFHAKNCFAKTCWSVLRVLLLQSLISPKLVCPSIQLNLMQVCSCCRSSEEKKEKHTSKTDIPWEFRHFLSCRRCELKSHLEIRQNVDLDNDLSQSQRSSLKSRNRNSVFFQPPSLEVLKRPVDVALRAKIRKVVLRDMVKWWTCQCQLQSRTQ